MSEHALRREGAHLASGAGHELRRSERTEAIFAESRREPGPTEGIAAGKPLDLYRMAVDDPSLEPRSAVRTGSGPRREHAQPGRDELA